MVRLPRDAERKADYLVHAINILKEMVQFHIDAAKRSRYARAAYYCAVARDIYYYLGKEEEFADYYDGIIAENNRRPALKDEMKRKVGNKVT